MEKIKIRFRHILLLAALMINCPVLASGADPIDSSTTGDDSTQRLQERGKAAARARGRLEERKWPEDGLVEVAQEAVNSLFDEGVAQLRAAGKLDLAEQMERERVHWVLFTTEEVGALDLGDHRPLHDRLASLYRLLVANLGEGLVSRLHLDDLNVLNYSIPVVFQPNGDRRGPGYEDQWDRQEYRKHFVPFAGVVSFWSSYAGCLAVTQSQPLLKSFCGGVAQGVRRTMVRHIAPRISDKVYDSRRGR